MGRESNMRILIFLLLLMMVLGSCSTYNVEGKLDETSSAYGQIVRWKKFETASTFAAPTIRAEFENRERAATNVEVLDYRVINVEYDKAKKKATVSVEISYRRPSSNEVKTIVDKQIWLYEEEKGSTRWQLTTLLPEFK
jgi:hypothetical protein